LHVKIQKQKLNEPSFFVLIVKNIVVKIGGLSFKNYFLDVLLHLLILLIDQFAQKTRDLPEQVLFLFKVLEVVAQKNLKQFPNIRGILA
jgi:hypothetical protein